MKNFIRRWRATWNPDMFHGWGKSKKFFEGWYYKLVDPTEEIILAFIPGISIGDTKGDHAFIQVVDGKACSMEYHNFEAEDFKPSAERFELELGNNFFSAEQLQLDLPTLKGHLQLKNRYPWPKMLGAPGIMGWFSFVPFMECYHGIVSMDYDLEGSLEIKGKMIDFRGGKGYVEKDWGTSFPSCWIWMQCNHFDSDQRVSLQASVANIPWVGSHFIGYIVGFLLGDKLYRFATYTGAKMKAVLLEDRVLLSFKDAKHRLEIIAYKTEGVNLVAPISGEMLGKVNESIQARMDVHLYEKDQLVFSASGKNAGMEVAGPVEQLLTDQWRR